MNAWNPHTFGTCLQTYNAGSNPVFPVPTRKEIFTTPNHLFCLSPSLGHGKLLPQTVWALFQLRIWEIDTFLLWATSLQSISKLQPCLQSKLLSSPRCFWIKLSLDMVPLIAFWLIVEQTLRRNLWQLCNDLNIHKIFTSSYHPQCDSFVELINGVIMQIIVMYVAADHKDWDTYLPSATCKHNNAWNPIMINMPRIIPSG